MCAKTRLLLLLFSMFAWADPAIAEDRYLTDLPWETGLVYDVYDPHYGRLSPEVHRNENFRGHMLSLRGKKYAKGLGVRGFSIVEYRLDGKHDRLHAMVGVDDEKTDNSGATIFSVWGDGRPLYTSPPLTRDDPPLQIMVFIPRVQRLKLITDSMSYGNHDLADWCEPTVIEKSFPPPVDHQFTVEKDQWFVRPTYHPFHLLYRGEPLQAEVMAGDASPEYVPRK